MGGCDFQVRQKGSSAKEAFQMATEGARYYYGHGGYTGSIAEKSRFMVLTVPPGMTADQYMAGMMGGTLDVAWNPYDDKWGPAGCIDNGDGTYTFFGTASS